MKDETVCDNCEKKSTCRHFEEPNELDYFGGPMQSEAFGYAVVGAAALIFIVLFFVKG